ncbi:sugar-binding transcriptional regulator [Pacificoceanicola onchidii]|uniref:sugar-binding transcriptional regulator n=1 Tax=Pacificoceanicola onchidii TaxID=2562685 RepID=UPI0010A31A55|nr:sugar-binding transcriptional regulator [Pacificoceanicola onchidii]
MKSADQKLDDAARAAWLAYVAGMKQDEIAAQMGISRQAAQRLVAQAMQAGLIKTRIDHPVAACMDLAERMRADFDLDICEVVPSLGSETASGIAVSHATGNMIESWLLREAPQIIGLGTGRTLRGAIEHLPHLECGQHKIVSLTGNIAPDGATAYYNVLFTIADKVSAQTYPMPLPVIAANAEERRTLLDQATLATTRMLAEKTDVRFVGVGAMMEHPPLVADGFITDADQSRLLEKGAVGEIVGFVFDETGALVADEINERVSSAALRPTPGGPVIGAANGAGKTRAIRAALKGGLLDGLVTDEETARALLAG